MDTKEELLGKLKPMELPSLPKNPLVSVLIANYNYEKYIGEAIESVLSQTYQNFEIVICDDGSMDNSLEVIRKYAERDNRIKYVAKENGGQSSALNNAFNLSRGSIVSILDADDVYLPTKLEKVVNAFVYNRGAGFVGHPLRVVDTHSRVLKDVHGRRLAKGWLAPTILAGGAAILPAASGIVLRREVAEICFPLPPEFRTLADCALRERAALVTICDTIPKTLALYRQHGLNVTGASGVTNLDRIEKAMHQVRIILGDRAAFIKKVYGIDVDSTMQELWEKHEIAGFLSARALLSGDSPPRNALDSLRSTRQTRAWRLLFTLPRPVAIQLFKLWWGEWPGKRWFRKIVPVNEW